LKTNERKKNGKIDSAGSNTDSKEEQPFSPLLDFCQITKYSIIKRYTYLFITLNKKMMSLCIKNILINQVQSLTTNMLRCLGQCTFMYIARPCKLHVLISYIN
jgi:hypothetical protein